MEDFTIKLPDNLSKEIADKVMENMKEAYYWNVTQKISDRLLEKMEEEGFIDKIVEEVYKQVVIAEDDFTKKIASEMKDSLLNCMSTIANETVKQVSKKITEYGFIKIGR